MFRPKSGIRPNHLCVTLGAPLAAPAMSLTIRLDLTNGKALGQMMGEIRAWLDREKIEVTNFKCAAARAGLTVDFSFATGEEAERFRERFVGP